MDGESRKWMILAATTWIQAFTGTNFDFSSYSVDLKSVLGISQVQLNYLAMASDLGKAFGWCSGIFLRHFPVWIVLFISAFMGLLGYGFQWLAIRRFISLPYFLVFLLCLGSGCSITWFNTVCYVLCINNFTSTRSLALSLSISFNGISAALYNNLVNAINPGDSSLYLLLNGVVPFITSVIVLAPILSQDRQPPAPNSVHNDYKIFPCLYAMAAFIGFYLFVANSALAHVSVATVILIIGLLSLMILPLLIFGCLDNGRQLRRRSSDAHETEYILEGNEGGLDSPTMREGCLEAFFMRGRLTMLGEEHSVLLLIRRLDFWLYLMAYFCGATIGLVYSNSLGHIAQSLGYNSDIITFVSIYSAFSFFGRLLSAFPDFFQQMNCARTGWFTLALVLTPVAFLLLVSSGSKNALERATALIGLGSGFVFSASASITSELFGHQSAGMNHNILIANIPLGSFLYGLLAAFLYKSNIDDDDDNSDDFIFADGLKVCIGRKCYFQIFAWWCFISFLGVASSFMLFLRTRSAYNRSLERNRNRT